jgi:hypothetical protein
MKLPKTVIISGLEYSVKTHTKDSSGYFNIAKKVLDSGQH